MAASRALRMVMMAGLLSAGTAHAVDLDGRKGIGYTQALGGPSGFAFDYAMGYLFVEGLFGLEYTSFPKQGDVDGDTTIGLTAGVGAHFQALRAPKAALTIGGRVNLGTGSVQADGGEKKDITQLGIDVPLRVYWFPNKHISLHAEMGVAFLIGPEDGVLFGADEGLPADGFQVRVFDGISALGLTFWW